MCKYIYIYTYTHTYSHIRKYTHSCVHIPVGCDPVSPAPLCKKF